MDLVSENEYGETHRGFESLRLRQYHQVPPHHTQLLASPQCATFFPLYLNWQRVRLLTGTF